MSSSTIDVKPPLATGVAVTDDMLSVSLADGRRIAIPLSWYPRLAHARPSERGNWRLLGGGEGISWPGIDEDISVGALLAGKRSAEGPASLQRWLATGAAIEVS